MRAWLGRHRPALMLAFLAPAVAEVLTGSTPITTLFVSPWFFIVSFGLLLPFYGGGALLVREAAVRWNKGWASVLLLGAAYGIVEEGLAVHTFFLTGGAPVGLLGSFGRWGGVNTVWALGLTAFHAVYSIALPILLVELMYPETRGARFLDGRMTYLVGAGYVGMVALFAEVTPGSPSTALFATFLGLALILVSIARTIPRDFLHARAGPTSAPPWTFVIAGLTFMSSWLIVGLGGPGLIGSAPLALGLLVAIGAATLGFVLRYAGTMDNRRAKFWFAAGMLGFFVFWDVILEFGIVPGSLALVPLLFGYLFWLHRRVRSRVDAPMSSLAAAISRDADR